MSDNCTDGVVSVLTPTYNRAALLRETLDSVAAQTYARIEMVIVDDGSSDNTALVVEEWSRHFVREGARSLTYLRQKHRGASAARNRAMLECTGEFIQFLDSDDLIHPEKLAKQVRRLRDSETADFTCARTAYFSEAPDWRAMPYTQLLQPGEDPLALYLTGHPWPTMSGLFRRSTCAAIGPWNEDAPILQDWDFTIRFLLGCPELDALDEVLFLQRVGHDDRITGDRLRESVLCARFQAAQQWMNWIAHAGRLDASFGKAFADRLNGLASLALRQGYSALAREMYRSTVRSSVAPASRPSARAYAALATLPPSVGRPAARSLSSVASATKRVNGVLAAVRVRQVSTPQQALPLSSERGRGARTARVEAPSICPICSHSLERTDETWTPRDLVDLWARRGVLFSPRVQSEILGFPEATLFHCPRCDLGLYLPPWEVGSRFYDEVQRTRRTYYLAEKWEYSLAIQDLPSGGRVLDVGCGTGEFLVAARRHGAVACGIELSERARSIAASRGLMVGASLDEASALSPDGLFDAVTAFQVLEHVPDPVAFLDGMTSHLREGGRLVLVAPNSRGSIRWVRPNHTNLPPHHLTLWSGASLVAAARRLGMEVVRVETEPLGRLHFNHLEWWWRTQVLAGRTLESPKWSASGIVERAGTHVIAGACRLLRSAGIETLPFIAGHSVYACLVKGRGTGREYPAHEASSLPWSSGDGTG